MSALQTLGLLTVGTVAGLDLVSGPQILLARPIVAGTLAGLVLGDATAGLLVGGILELYALEVLPVGATRYPDHGPGTVAAVWLTVQTGTGLAAFGVLLALLVAEIGGHTLIALRRWNGRALVRATPALERGEIRAAAGLQLGGAFRDMIRSALLTALALGLAAASLPIVLRGDRLGALLIVIVVGAGLAGAVAGAIRTAGRSPRAIALGLALVVGWFVAGMVGIYPRWGGW